MKYTIEFRNSAGGIIGAVENVTGNFYCTNDYDSATSVIMFATYRGRSGSKTNETLSAAPKPITPSTTSITQEGITFLYLYQQLPFCVCVFVIILTCTYVCM